MVSRVEQDRMHETCTKLRRPADSRGTCQGIRPAVNVGLSVSRDMSVFIRGISSNLLIQLKCNEVNILRSCFKGNQARPRQFATPYLSLSRLQ